MPKECLIPGYHQVDAFGPDEDYVHNEDGEVEEEVSYVILDLGNVEPTLVPSSSTYRLIGLDTPHPFLQLSGTIFKGRHQDLLGTELIFAEAQDSADPSQKSVVHLANTEQRIQFKEVELKAKPTTGQAAKLRGDSSSESTRPQTTTHVLTRKGKEKALPAEATDHGSSQEALPGEAMDTSEG